MDSFTEENDSSLVMTMHTEFGCFCLIYSAPVLKVVCVQKAQCGFGGAKTVCMSFYV